MDLQEVPAVLVVQNHHIWDHSIRCPVLLSLLSRLDYLFHLSSHSGPKKPNVNKDSEVNGKMNKYDFHCLNWLNFESRTDERLISYPQSVDIKV